MADQYKPGDVVRLRSGGVPMTVVDLGQHKQTGKPACRCVWMVNGEVKRSVFQSPTLDGGGTKSASTSTEHAKSAHAHK